eukprot:1051205-Pyramimonas_sp.AAC.1
MWSRGRTGEEDPLLNLREADDDLEHCKEVCKALQRGEWRDVNSLDGRRTGQRTASYSRNEPSSAATGSFIPHLPQQTPYTSGGANALRWSDPPRRMDAVPLSHEDVLQIGTDAAVQLAYQCAFGPQPPPYRKQLAKEHAYRLGHRKVRFTSARTRSFEKPYGALGRPRSMEGLPALEEDSPTWWDLHRMTAAGQTSRVILPETPRLTVEDGSIQKRGSNLKRNRSARLAPLDSPRSQPDEGHDLEDVRGDKALVVGRPALGPTIVQD